MASATLLETGECVQVEDVYAVLLKHGPAETLQPAKSFLYKLTKNTHAVFSKNADD